MSWKDLSYPIKGIIIGLGIGFVLSLLTINCLRTDTSAFVSSCISYSLWALPLMILLGDVFRLPVSENLLTFISMVLSGILYGWIFGLIVGKIKAKEEIR